MKDASDNPDEYTIAALRTDSGAEMVSGAKSGYYCKECGADVTLAPSSQALIATKAKVIVLCLECISPDMLSQATVAPGAVDELRRHAVQRLRN